jgi:hypothetical protein
MFSMCSMPIMPVPMTPYRISMAETPTGSGADIVETGARTIGESGFEVGPLAYGLWRFTTPDVNEAQGSSRPLSTPA